MSAAPGEPLPIPDPPVTPVAWIGSWRDGHLRVLDQTRLPRHETILEHRTLAGVVDDIRRLGVRGAPVIGIAGAYGMVLAARGILADAPTLDRPTFLARLRAASRRLAEARPTAVNLPAAVARSLHAAEACPGSPEQAASALLEVARALEAYERDACARIGRAGADWLRGHRRFLTHCNAGALVTSGIGTALAPLYVLHAAGEAIHVWVDETRPLLQGLRLTAYELGKAGVPHAVSTDGAAASLLRAGQVDAVIVGADRICANGDVANKVGTYALAVLARHHGVPFVVAAPLSTLDPATPTGAEVTIEERPADATLYLSEDLLPAGSPVHAPAFDVTPAALVSALVTEEGTLTRPDAARLAPWRARATTGLEWSPDAGR